MSRSVHSGRIAIPVATGIVLTIAVCGLCMAAYIKYVVDPKIRELSLGVQTVCAEEMSGERAVSTPPQYRRHQQEVDARTAALIRGLRETKNAMQASIEEDGGMPEDDRPSEEEIRAIRQKEITTLDNELTSESVDPEWAVKMEKITEEAVAELDGDLELEEVTCRKTFCRARFTHLDPTTRSNDIDRLSLHPELSTQSTTYVPPDNENATVMYFARQGHTLSIYRLQIPDLNLPPGMEGKID
jgi:hypothetical protein